MEDKSNQLNAAKVVTMSTNNEKERMTDAQADIIIEFMATHSAFAFNKSLGCNPKAVKDKLWNELKNLVDKAKGSPKTVDQIQNWWSRNKSQAKKYNGAKKTLLKATGNPQNDIQVNQKFEKILSITGTSHKQGLEIIPEVGCQIQDALKVITYEEESVKKNSQLSLGAKRKIDHHAGSTNVSKKDTNSEIRISENVVSMKKRVLSSTPQASTLPLDASTKPTIKPVNTYLHSSSTFKMNESPLSVLVGNDCPSRIPKTSTLAPKQSNLSSQVYSVNEGKKIETKFNNVQVMKSPEGENNGKGKFKQHFLNKMQSIASSCSPKTSFTQARSEMTMEALAEGSESVRSFTKAFVEVSSKKNALLQETNDILRDMLSKM